MLPPCLQTKAGSPSRAELVPAQLDALSAVLTAETQSASTTSRGLPLSAGAVIAWWISMNGAKKSERSTNVPAKPNPISYV